MFNLFAKEESSSSGAEWKNAIKAGFSLSNRLSFLNASATDGTTTENYDEIVYSFAGGNVLGFERQKIKSNGWGHAFGLDYNTEVEVEEVEIDDTSLTVIGSDRATIQVSVLYFN